MAADPLVAYDVVRALQIAADGHTVSAHLADGTVLTGPAVADQHSMVLRITDTGVTWIVPTGGIIALSVS